MNRKFVICVLLLVISVSVLAPKPAAAFSLVPCGQILNEAKTNADATHPCQLQDLIRLIMRVINYLISVAAMVAMYEVLSGGFGMVVALGNPDKIKGARESVTQAIVGFGMVLAAFVFINLLVNGIFGQGGVETAKNRNWYDPVCIYGIGDTSNTPNKCPLGVSTNEEGQKSP